MKAAGYLGLDLGGTGAKAGVFDQNGLPVALARVPFRPAGLTDGRVEMPIETIYSAVRLAARRAVRRSGLLIDAMAISSQGETFVPLDGNGRPLYPAILWYDNRAVEQCRRLQAAVNAGASSSPAPAVEAICTGPKIMWLHENLPEVASKARCYLLLPAYLSYRLTGEAVLDPTMAVTTGLYADGSSGYHAEALQAAGVRPSQLPEIRPAGEAIGKVRPAAAQEWGLGPETKLVNGVNDQFAGALGAGNCRLGIVSESSGTCLALVALTERPLAALPPGVAGGRFPLAPYGYALSYVRTAGILLEWFRRQFRPSKTLAELEGLASSAPLGSRGVVVLPHFDGIVAPDQDPEARGFICNLSLDQTAADVYRAILESLACSLRQNLELLRAGGVDCSLIRSTGGGARSDFWLQMKADVTGLVVERSAFDEAATMGAAMLAAFGARRFGSLNEAVSAFFRSGRTFLPDDGARSQYEPVYSRFTELYDRVYASSGGH